MPERRVASIEARVDWNGKKAFPHIFRLQIRYHNSTKQENKYKLHSAIANEQPIFRR